MAYSIDELNGLGQERELLVLKLNRLRQAVIVETDESRRFAYEQEINQWENRKNEIDKIVAKALCLDTDSGKERLRAVVRNLKISEPMGRLHLVNCNRQDVRDRFEEGFDRRKKMGAINHFYFLSACPTQLPPSLGERMVYELLGDLLEDGKEALYCRFNTIDHDRVKLEKMPLGYSLEKSQEEFRKFCAEWFNWPAATPFEQALQTSLLPKAKYQYAVLPFYLNKKDWKACFPEYFDWLAAQLAARPDNGPKLLVFIVLHLDDLHNQIDPATGKASDAKADEILGAINALCEQHPNAGHYFPLPPVHETDLRDWFTDLGERNNARLQPVLDALAEGLPEEEREQFRQSELLNMDRVELVQELVFDLYNT